MIRNFCKLLAILFLTISISCKHQTTTTDSAYDIGMSSQPYFMPPYDSLGYHDKTIDYATATQTDLTQGEGDNFTLAANRLKLVYDSTIILYKDDTATLICLIKNQQAWEAYKNSLVELKFHGDGWGTSTSMCESTFLEKIYDDRIKILNHWYYGYPQGDECAGSERTLDYSYGDIDRYQNYLKSKKGN